jgi:hypothetical protein
MARPSVEDGAVCADAHIGDSIVPVARIVADSNSRDLDN